MVSCKELVVGDEYVKEVCVERKNNLSGQMRREKNCGGERKRGGVFAVLEASSQFNSNDFVLVAVVASRSPLRLDLPSPGRCFRALRVLQPSRESAPRVLVSLSRPAPARPTPSVQRAAQRH